jgi:hypothetical protein
MTISVYSAELTKSKDQRSALKLIVAELFSFPNVHYRVNKTQPLISLISLAGPAVLVGSISFYSAFGKSLCTYTRCWK